jgi:hypothetical protein
MNERIRELAEQCYHRYSEHNIDLERFAEKIVRECLSIVEPEVDCDEECCVILKGTAQEIKQHFGVEE